MATVGAKGLIRDYFVQLNSQYFALNRLEDDARLYNESVK